MTLTFKGTDTWSQARSTLQGAFPPLSFRAVYVNRVPDDYGPIMLELRDESVIGNFAEMNAEFNIEEHQGIEGAENLFEQVFNIKLFHKERLPELAGPTTPLSNFYTEVILKDPRLTSLQRVNDVALLEPITREKVLSIVDGMRKLHHIEMMVFETFRSKERQEQLFEQGHTTLKKVGVHHYGLACDIVFVRDGQPVWTGNWDLMGQLAREEHFVWGGDWHTFVDRPHVQRCALKRQRDLFAGIWYPPDDYDPVND